MVCELQTWWVSSRPKVDLRRAARYAEIDARKCANHFSLPSRRSARFQESCPCCQGSIRSDINASNKFRRHLACCWATERGKWKHCPTKTKRSYQLQLHQQAYWQWASKSLRQYDTVQHLALQFLKTKEKKFQEEYIQLTRSNLYQVVQWFGRGKPWEAVERGSRPVHQRSARTRRWCALAEG